MKLTSAFSAALVLSLTAAAQTTAAVGGAPVLGYVFDMSSRALRPILGIPRAASLGAPFESEFAISDIAISSGQSYALAMAGDGGVRFINLNNGSLGSKLSATPLPIVGRARALYLSPRGTAAAVLTDGWIGFVTGMSAGNPQVTGLAFADQPVAASVSDDGMYLLAALQDGSLSMFGRDGSRIPLMVPAAVSRVVFRPGSTDALASTADNRVWFLQRTTSAATVTQVAGPEDGVSSPAGLGFLPDGNRAVAANPSGAILTIDVTSGAKTSVACSCNPTGFEPMAAPGVFRLTEAPGQPQYMFDGSSLQTFFVPAAPMNREKSISERSPRELGTQEQERGTQE